MRNAILILVALGGCGVGDTPSVSIAFDPNDSVPAVVVTYGRDAGYDFSGVHATLNGIDMGAPAISEGGGDSSQGNVFNGGGPIGSFARWAIDPATVGSTAHVVIDDGGEELIVDATIGPSGAVVTDCSSNLTC